MKKLAIFAAFVLLFTPLGVASAQSDPVEYDGSQVEERLREEGLDQAPAPVEIRETTSDTPPALVTADEMMSKNSDDSMVTKLAVVAIIVAVIGAGALILKRKRS